MDEREDESAREPTVQHAVAQATDVDSEASVANVDDSKSSPQTLGAVEPQQVAKSYLSQTGKAPRTLGPECVGCNGRPCFPPSPSRPRPGLRLGPLC